MFWTRYKENHPNIAQFIVFLILSYGVTFIQLGLMPIFKSIFAHTSLVSTNLQIFELGNNFDGSPLYLFDYAAGPLSLGGGGGLAYFLAVQLTLAVAQVINFFAQRNITFKSDGNIWIDALWYIVAYIFITIIAALAQSFYKTPIYDLLMHTWDMGSLGETTADMITMKINGTISFWVFFPIFKVIFRQRKTDSRLV